MTINLFGTKIYLSFWFFAFLSLMLCIDQTGILLPTLVATLFHETAHLLAMKRCGVAPLSIRLIPASIQIVRPHCKTGGDEIFIALAGPLCNLLWCLSCLLVFRWMKSLLLLTFSLVNLLLAVFNLLPVAGLDGGTVLFGLLNRRFSPNVALLCFRVVGILCSGAFFGIGVWLLQNGKINLSFFILPLYFTLCSILKI